MLDDNPVCMVCLSSLATEVDHIVNNDDHSYENLQGICTRCHRTKSAQEGQTARHR